MRRLRIAAPAQLAFNLPVTPDEAVPHELWASLPEPAQARLLSLFARLIARGVVVNPEHREEEQ